MTQLDDEWFLKEGAIRRGNLLSIGWAVRLSFKWMFVGDYRNLVSLSKAWCNGWLIGRWYYPPMKEEEIYGSKDIRSRLP